MNAYYRLWGGCSTVGRTGCLVVRRSFVQILAELHVEVSLSKILNPKLHLMCTWHLVTSVVKLL